MMKTLPSIFIILLATSSLTFGQSEALQKGLDAITKESAQAQLEFLSSDWMEGRATGEKGEFLSGDYISSMLQFIGISPAGDDAWAEVSMYDRMNGVRPKKYTSYYQNYYLTKYLENSSELSLIFNKSDKVISFNEKNDFSISNYPSNINITSNIVFVGYGFTDKNSGYDDFKGVNVKGKIILRLKSYPGHLDTSSVGYKKFHQERIYFEYYLEKEKNKIALEKGAIGVINVYEQDVKAYWSRENDFDDLSPNESPATNLYDHKIKLNPNENAELIEIHASKHLVQIILENQNIDIKTFENNISNSLKPESKILNGIKVDIKYNSKTEILHTRNILGVIKGENPNEIVVIGGHYDHVGMNDGFIWNGADDNASGTVGVLMLAKAFIASGVKPKKTIVFAAWSGEEVGLYGSEFFTNNPYGEKIENIKLYLNFDMISKASENDTLNNQSEFIYTENPYKISDLTKNNITKYNINLNINYVEAHLGHSSSDHASFRNKKIPVIYFSAGYPKTLHTPKDETSDVNYDKMVDIIKLSYLNLWEIVNK